MAGASRAVVLHSGRAGGSLDMAGLNRAAVLYSGRAGGSLYMAGASRAVVLHSGRAGVADSQYIAEYQLLHWGAALPARG